MTRPLLTDADRAAIAAYASWVKRHWRGVR